MASLDDLVAALHARGYEKLEAAAPNPQQMRLVGRVHSNAINGWLLVIHRILVRAKAADWQVDVSKNYFLREVAGKEKIFFGWRLIFQTPKPQLLPYLPDIINTIRTTPQSNRIQVDEMPLMGVTADRNAGGGGRRGAGLVGQTPTGPMAVRSRMVGD